MPLFHKAHDLGLPIVVHAATIPADYKRTLEAYDLARSMGRVLDHTLATIRLIFSDHLRELPNLKFFQGHLGGAMFILRGRFDPSYKTHWNPAEVEYDKYIDQMYFDTAPPFWYKAEVRCAIDTLGADHICYGSDYPIQPDWIERSVEIPVVRLLTGLVGWRQPDYPFVAFYYVQIKNDRHKKLFHEREYPHCAGDETLE